MPVPQLVRQFVQRRSVLVVLATEINCVDVHAVRGLQAVRPSSFWKFVTPSQVAHTRSLVAVGAESWYEPRVEHAVGVLHDVCPV